MIEVQNLKKGFGGDELVLKGISTTFDKGKTNLIIGQSGSGKTVFLKCLLGLFRPTEGKILYDGEAYSELSSEKQRTLREQMGMVFQGSALFDSMTVEENIMFPLKMFTKQRKAERRERANEVIERVNLINANNKLPSEISGGMQKRVAIARAIVNNPKYLFCDEPNSGLDPRTATLIDNLIQEITHEYEITTIINTHDMNSVMEIGENIMYIHKGQKWWEGDNKTIITTDNKEIDEFVYASKFMQTLRNKL